MLYVRNIPFWESHHIHNYVHDPSGRNLFGIVEIKCPYKFHAVTPEVASTHSDFFCDLFKRQISKTVRLKLTHYYQYQIQGQMGVTGRNFCNFVVYTQEGVSVERIDAIYGKVRYYQNLWISMTTV